MLPTRKEGKYIVKKREHNKEDKADDDKADDDKADNKADDKEVDESVNDKEVDEETEEEEAVYEEPVKPKPKPTLSASASLKPKLKVIPRIDNDNTYLFYQILIQLQRITEILEMNRQDVEREKMFDHLVDEVINAQNKYEKDKEERDRYEIYEKAIQQTIQQVPQQAPQPIYRKRNNIFADMG